jgi:hypothetical protein
MVPAPLLLRLTRNDTPKAQDRARTAVRERQPGHSDVLAQLSFGTWRFLLPDHDAGRQLLWQQATSQAFPYLTSSSTVLVNHVGRIHKLRNRIAHLEPLLDSAMVADRFVSVRAVVAAIDPITDNWIVSRQRVTSVLRNKPTPGPR